jgi:hypothetical protein
MLCTVSTSADLASLFGASHLLRHQRRMSSLTRWRSMQNGSTPFGAIGDLICS